MSRIVITGASGFIGSAIATAGRQQGHEVIGLSRRVLPGFQTVDVQDPETLAPHLEGADTVVHASGLAHVFGRAASDAAAFERANADGAEAVAAAAARAKVSHMLLLSSVSVYGGSDARGVDEGGRCDPVGPYASSKLSGEQRAAATAARYGLGLTTLRLATVYGEGDRGNVARLMRLIDTGRFIWIGRGVNRKSLIHRDDVAAAVLAAASAGARGTRTFNVSADPVLMRDVVDGLARALQKRIAPVRIPDGVARLGASAADRLGFRGATATVSKWLADDFYRSAKIREELGVIPRVSLAQGLSRQVAHYRETRG